MINLLIGFIVGFIIGVISTGKILGMSFKKLVEENGWELKK